MKIEKHEVAEAFAKGTNSELVQLIGLTVVLYKESKKNKKIVLPKQKKSKVYLMKKVGILGGTFNPPHIGHLIMANEVYHALELDEVRFMPNAIAPHKKNEDDSTDDNRLQWWNYSLSHILSFTVETIEVERGGISYTYDTMIALMEREPDTQFYFIIGGDMIDYAPYMV